MAEQQDLIPGGRAPRARRRRDSSSVRKGRLKVHDPFELIRWLALSQPDPRKALAELVQNSLDARASHITVTRRRRNKVTCLEIRDDGEGVIPEMERAEALGYLATHIGHSRKRKLTPQERHRLMTQGQYGIGLLGFWSLGQSLEIRTHVPGERPHRLVLHRDRPEYVIEPMRARPDDRERWTEILVVGLHKEAMPMLTARRASDYLASELRGQLLGREVELMLFDRIARGRSLRQVKVEPKRFLGQRIQGVDRLPVEGHAAAKLELYLEAGDREREGLKLYAAGTLVAESFRELAGIGLDCDPWIDSRLSGMVDFSSLSVTPGNRRGVIPDQPAFALARALRSLAPTVEEFLEQEERRRTEELDKTMVRDLQRAFRDFYRQLPRYALLPVAAQEETKESAEIAEPPLPEGVVIDPSNNDEGDGDPTSIEEVSELPPAGPLHSLRIEPSPVRIGTGSRRLVRVLPLDEHGHKIDDELELLWRVRGVEASVRGIDTDPTRVWIVARFEVGTGMLRVVGLSGDREATCETELEIVESLGPASASDEGIPEPELVDEPGARWRSRLGEGRWQVNSGHPGYRAISDRPALKLRYLALLFAKEVVLRSSLDPRLNVPLEQLVEVYSYADRQLTKKVRRKSRSKK